MSVHRRKRAGGRVVWQVTWRDESGRQRAETFVTEREALQRDAELRELRWLGRIDRADAGKESLREATEVWWTDHVEPNLARSTILSYAYVLDGHLMPLLGDVPIREIDPARVIQLQRELREREVGAAMTHRVMMVLSGVMRHAVVRGRIDRNPVTPVKVAQPRRQRAIRPLAPASVEALRNAFLARDDIWSATFVSVMAYGGLRPGEALALDWDHVGQHRILVEQAVSQDGPRSATKTKSMRSVRLIAPLAEDLEAWRAVCGGGADDTIFARRDGGPLTPVDYRNWRRRRFEPACSAADLAATRPYDLRHSFASLMIQAGYSPVELAAELGHAPTLTLNTYAHLFSEFSRGSQVDPEQVIASARRPPGRAQ
jgi:integrase